MMLAVPFLQVTTVHFASDQIQEKIILGNFTNIFPVK
jgi:hypothetical protein